ncbi:MAG: putative toxin-antitoxin system toxin component, PIN family [Thermomicrobiales bacterium]
MRVLLDTNVLISYLLPSGREPGTIHQIVEAAFAGDFRLLAAEQTIQELLSTVSTRPYFTARITSDQLASFVEALRAIAEVLPHPLGDLPAIVRDPDDDVILAIAIMGEADYLVTGDRDLLAIRDVMASPRIVHPSEFVTGVLRRE